MKIAQDFYREIKACLEKGKHPIEVSKDRVLFSNQQSIPIIPEKRSILIIDICGFSKRNNEEQLVLIETLNQLIKVMVKTKYLNDEPWDIYKGTGDGAIFVFGIGVSPSSVVEVIRFAVNIMGAIIKNNNELLSHNINNLEVRMAISYGDIYATEDLLGNKDIIGDAINITSRLVSAKIIFPYSILISNEVYQILQINKKLFFVNNDKSMPEAGELSDYVVGSNPDANNYLYITDEGYADTKDRKLKSYNISGRIDSVNIERKIN